MDVYYDPSGRSAGAGTLRMRGAILAFIIALGAVAVFQYYVGNLSSTVKIQLTSSVVSDDLSRGSEVKFRGLTVGRVDSIHNQSKHRQKIWLSLNPTQASGMRGIISAHYVASNLFGASSIELLDGGGDKPLRNGDVVHVDTSSPFASIPHLIREIASLTPLLGTEKVQNLLTLLTQNGDIIARALSATLSAGKVLSDNLRKPVIDVIHDVVPLLDGLDLIINPGINALNNLNESLSFLTEPGGAARTSESVDNVRYVIFDGLSQIIGNAKRDGVDSLGVLLDIGHPLFLSAASVASAWGNLETFLDRMQAAMPSIDGKVKMRLEILLPASRALPVENDTEGETVARSEVMRNLSTQEQQQVQDLQAQILGFIPYSEPPASAPDTNNNQGFEVIPSLTAPGVPR